MFALRRVYAILDNEGAHLHLLTSTAKPRRHNSGVLSYTITCMKNIAGHITSILSATGAIIALVHPGFQLPVATQSITVALCVIVAGSVQLYHQLTHHNLDIVSAQTFAKEFAAQAANVEKAVNNKPVA